MTSREQRSRATRTPVVLAVLFAGAFVMGCAEMLVVGLLDLISADLDVSVPAAGALVTANALGLAVGGPLLTLLTTRLDRRMVLLLAVSVFVLANLLPALVADYQVFVIARVVIGAVQGLFIAAALTTATSLVPAERVGSAMAVVISGFAAASAFGLPVGTLLGHAVGWRGSFVAVVAVGAIVLVAAVGVLPSVPTSPASGAAGQARHAFAPRVLAVLGLCFLIFTAVQSVLTYLVPFLTRVTGVSAAGVSVFLLVYGVATTVGSMGGGRFADANASRSLVIGTVGLTASLVAMNLFGANAPLAAVCVLAMGLFAMGMAPSMQHRVVTLAGPGAPLASSLPASAVNAGIAFGSFVGGVAIAGWGVSATVVAGVAVAALSVCAAWATSHLHPSEVRAGVEPVGAP